MKTAKQLILGFGMLVGFIMALNSYAGFIVYKVKYKVNEYHKDSSSSEWEFLKKNDQLSCWGYFIFDSNFDTSGDKAPARIIIFSSKKNKFRPLGKDGQPDMSRKLTNKLIIYPLDAENPLTGKTLTPAENYGGLTKSKADSYYILGGTWNTVKIEKSTQKKNIISFIDYYSNPLIFTSGSTSVKNNNKLVVDTDVKGYSEFISGRIKKNSIATAMRGYLTYYTSDSIGKSTTVLFKYDSKILDKAEKATDISATSMRAAVNAIVDYLVQKGYASTWDE